MVPPTSAALPDSAIVAAPASQAFRPTGPVGREQASPGHPDRITLGIKQFHRFVEEHRRRRLRQPTWPRLAGVGPRHRFVAQWREGDPLGRSAAPAEHRYLHGLRPEQSLHPDQRPPGPQPVLVADPTPQRKLQCACGNHLHRLQPQHGDGSGGPVCRDFVRFNQPSNCQRIRSAVASSVNGSAHRHTLLSSSPSAVTAWIASLVHPTPADSRLRCSSAASDLPANAAASIRSIGGSQFMTASSSGGGSRPDGPRIGSARAIRWASIASAPNRETTSARDSAANAPKVRIPMRHNRSTTSSRPGADKLGSAASCRIDSADRNTASPPGSTTRPARAAKTAVGSSSAIPI